MNKPDLFFQGQVRLMVSDFDFVCRICHAPRQALCTQDGAAIGCGLALPHHSPVGAAVLPELANTPGTPLPVYEGSWESTIIICAVIAPGLPRPGQWVYVDRSDCRFITSLAACHCAAPFAARNTEWSTYGNVYAVIKEQARGEAAKTVLQFGRFGTCAVPPHPLGLSCPNISLYYSVHF